MEKQGTSPQFVSIGNEINDGFLYPDGQISKSWEKFAALFNSGSKAVRNALPNSKVILHITGATSPWFDIYFDNCKKYGVDFDIIGASWYPFWHKSTAVQMREWSEGMYARYGKKVMIMETGYPWNPTLPDGAYGQLSNNGPYQNVYPSSKEGQKNFMLEVFSEIKKSKDGCVLGDVYWDPVMIEVPGVGWELGADNVVSNTTLFDFEGHVNEVLDAYKYNN